VRQAQQHAEATAGPEQHAGHRADVAGKAVSEPLTFNLIFSIPQLDSAFMRNPAGGARIKLDIAPETVADANRMLDLMAASAGVTFAAVVVVVGQPQQDEPQAVRIRTWKKGK
jgi:hypothetical protein